MFWLSLITTSQLVQTNKKVKFAIKAQKKFAPGLDITSKWCTCFFPHTLTHLFSNMHHFVLTVTLHPGTSYLFRLFCCCCSWCSMEHQTPLTVPALPLANSKTYFYNPRVRWRNQLLHQKVRCFQMLWFCSRRYKYRKENISPQISCSLVKGLQMWGQLQRRASLCWF